ncbi:cytochrome p450 76c4, partial [Quercus suber]
NGGKVVDIGRAAFITVLNVISNTFFSIDLAHYSSDLSGQDFQELVCVIMEIAGKPDIADYFPVLRLVDPQGAQRRMTICYAKLIEIFDRIINERGPNARNDLLDSFLNLAEDDNSELSHNDFKHLLLVLTNFLIALLLSRTPNSLLELTLSKANDKSITLSLLVYRKLNQGLTQHRTVEWAMAELLHNPEKIAKARDELEKVLGKDGLVQELDISKFPFLQAIVKETFRLHPPAPFLVPHKVETFVEMCGFTVPKNAQIIVNVWAMGRDPSIWTDPNIFLPERFLERTTDFKGQDFELIPFGAGRRICPGLPLANKMVHLMLASLVHCFHWRLADELKPEDIDMSETFGITLHRSEPFRAIPIRV